MEVCRGKDDIFRVLKTYLPAVRKKSLGQRLLKLTQIPLWADPLMLEPSPRFRRWSSSVASPAGSVRCIPQCGVECARDRSAAFLAAVQSHQRDHQFGSSNFLILGPASR